MQVRVKIDAVVELTGLAENTILDEAGLPLLLADKEAFLDRVLGRFGDIDAKSAELLRPAYVSVERVESDSADEGQVLYMCDATDGCELYVGDELYVAALELQKRGVVSVSGARGAGRRWVRVERIAKEVP